jgi:tetratricopeptide (TPR) repeat protein
VPINVQRIRASTNEHLWAESYDRKLENIFGVEGEVAAAVAEAMKAKLTGAAQQALAQKPTNNPEAYGAHLRGLAYSLRPGYSLADTLGAIKYFDEAVKLDPKFALAWARRGHENALGYFNRIGDNVLALRHLPDLRQTKPSNSSQISVKPTWRKVSRTFTAIAIMAVRSHYSKRPDNFRLITVRFLARALVWRRLGEWQRSLHHFRQAMELDPRKCGSLRRATRFFGNAPSIPSRVKSL